MTAWKKSLSGALCAALVAASCADTKGPPPVQLTKPRNDRTYIRDGQNRYLQFHGINVSCATKIGPPGKNAQGQESYVGRPFPLSEAREHYARLRAAGFNSMRLLVLWEGVEPRQKGEYDEEYIAYVRELVKLANEYGLYVLIDFHQDIFSRHLFVKFNSKPAVGEKGSIENTLMSLVQPFDERVQGDGAPRWAVEACLPEKNLDSKHWGTPRITSALTQDELVNIYDVYQKIASGQLLGGSSDAGVSDGGMMTADAGMGGDAGIPPWVYQFALSLPEPFAPNESNDMLPFTQWGLAHAISLDVARAYACFFAGNKVFPGLQANGEPVQDYLQDAYAKMAAKVAEAVADQPNVMGYDLMNEPSGNYIPLVALAGLMKAGAPGAESALVSLLGPETGRQVLRALVALRLLPPDTRPETLRLYGVDKLDLGAALGLNNGFDENYMRPFYEKTAHAILEKHPGATMYIESTTGLGTVLGGGPGGGLIPGLWEFPMRHLEGVDNLVFAPHWYPDIYPFLGFNVDPRSFTAEQVRYREYDEQLKNAAALSSYSLGNVPVVFGEFGTYFNFNGIKSARAAGYDVSAHIIDNYHESFERMNQSNMQWCYSPENSYAVGDGWNREDFSILDPNQQPRAEKAWARPFARALAGKPISTHFYSDYHYFDPDKGEVPPMHEFEVRYAAMETQAPTEISVPAVQYPDGFYVWVSDGQAYFDAERAVLYHRPEHDEPGVEHWVRIRPPLPGGLNDGWQYFIKGSETISRRARP